MKRIYSPKILFLLCVFILLMVFSTPAVMLVRGLRINEVDFISLPEQNEDITKSIYYTTISDNVDGEVEIAGYAYMETSEDNSDKKIDLLLQSDKHAYCIPTTLSIRHDLSAERTGKNIQGIRHSFSGRFSYLQLPDGVYNLGLFCYENDNTQDYVSLERNYRKRGRSFTQTVLPSFDAAGHKTMNSNGVDFTNINEISSDHLPWHYVYMRDQDNEYLHLYGWIAIVSMDSAQAKSFVALTDESGKTQAYTTVTYESDELEETVGSSLANNGFFNAYIPLDELEPGEYRLDLIVQYPDATCKPEISHKVIISPEKKVTFVSGFSK